jgi:hypothetical protein
MRIELSIHREGGSKVEVSGTTYHFAPQPDGRHIADVADPEHALVLLRCDPAYQPAELTDPKEAPPPVAPQSTGAFAGTDPAHTHAITPAATQSDHAHPVGDGIHAHTVAVGEVTTTTTPPVAPPVAAGEAEESGTHPDTLEMVKADQVNTIKAAIESAPATEPAPQKPVEEPNPYDEMSKEEVWDAFKARFGRDPAPRSSRKNVIGALMKPVEA